MCRHRQHRANRCHAGAAHPGQQDVIAIANAGQVWRGEGGKGCGDIGKRGCGWRCGQPRAFNGHKARAEAVKAGEILVAARQIDLPLAPKRGVHRLDAEAVRGHRTIAASLADSLVDDHMPVRILHRAPLAPPPFFGGAGLAVDQDRYAFERAQLALQRVHLGAVMKTGNGGVVAPRHGIELITDKGDAGHPLGSTGLRNTGR